MSLKIWILNRFLGWWLFPSNLSNISAFLIFSSFSRTIFHLETPWVYPVQTWYSSAFLLFCQTHCGEDKLIDKSFLYLSQSVWSQGIAHFFQIICHLPDLADLLLLSIRGCLDALCRIDNKKITVGSLDNNMSFSHSLTFFDRGAYFVMDICVIDVDCSFGPGHNQYYFEFSKCNLSILHKCQQGLL